MRRKLGQRELFDPSMAIVLPNGDVLVSDDNDSRVIVIDRDTKKIVCSTAICTAAAVPRATSTYPSGWTSCIPIRCSTASLPRSRRAEREAPGDRIAAAPRRRRARVSRRDQHREMKRGDGRERCCMAEARAIGH